MLKRRTVLSVAVAATVWSVGLGAAGGRASIDTTDLKSWLTYIASDELEGRSVYTEGLGLAAGYIQDHLREWGVTPRGDNGGRSEERRVGKECA